MNSNNNNKIPIGQLEDALNNSTQYALNLKQNLSEKGSPGGYASLDNAGKIPSSQLPNSIIEYKGTYNALTNSPFLVDGTGNTGDTYRVNVQGAGVNGLNFVVGDYVIYNGTVWEKSHGGADNINSVFGRTGAITSQNGDYNASQVTNTPAGNISSVTVQAALNELDSEKAADSAVVHLLGTETITGSKTFVTNTNIDAITLSSTPNSTTSERRVVWDDTVGTAVLGLKGGNINLPLGQVLVNRVINKQGSNLTKAGYSVVYAFGGQGNRITFKQAQANATSTSTGILGLVFEDINNNQEGFIINKGEIVGINTTGSLQGEIWADGDILYLSSTSPGGLTKSKPISPNRVVRVGLVTNAHATQGSIDVTIYQSLLLSDLNDVLETSLTNNDILAYETSTGLWKNRPLAALGAALASRSLTINGVTQDLSADRIYNVGDVFTTSSYSNPTWITSLAWSKITSTPTTLAGYGITNAVPNTRTITINGVTQDLSTDRTWRAAQVSSGVYIFGGATQASGTQVNVGAITGVIVNNESVLGTSTFTDVSFPATNNITVPTLGSGISTHVLLNSSNTLVFQNTFPTPQQRRQMIYLFKIGHPTGTITTVINEPDFSIAPLSQFRDWMQAINYINQGVYASTNGANLQVNLSSGEIIGDGINYTNSVYAPNNLAVSAASPVSWLYRTQTGLGGGATNLIQPTNYDVAGVVTAVPGGGATSTLQYIYFVPGANLLIVQYGQTTYTSLNNAIAAIGKESRTVYPSLVRSAILINILAVSKNCTDLTDTTRAQFFKADMFGQAGGAAAGTSTLTAGTGITISAGVISRTGQVIATVNTTNATITTINTIPTVTDAKYFIKGTVIGNRTGGSSGAAGDFAAYEFSVAVKNNAGTVTLHNPVIATGAYEDQVAWNVDAAVSGTDVLIRVAGAANNNISWTSDFAIKQG